MNTEEKIAKPLTGVTSWLYDGPIYETHPYYYPNHSFEEISQQISSLKDLGIKTIYLMPVFKHTNNTPADQVSTFNDMKEKHAAEIEKEKNDAYQLGAIDKEKELKEI